MKRQLKQTQSNFDYLLKISLDFYSDNMVAAGSYISDPSLKRSKKMSEEQVKELEKVIHSILDTIERYDFKLIYHKQSPFSYTYYIVFTPTDSNGDIWEYNACIQVEVRDHDRNVNPEGGWVNNDRYIKIFHVGNKSCFNVSGVVSEFKKICLQLRNGDYSSLEPMPDLTTN